jgi:hypothetical protein
MKGCTCDSANSRALCVTCRQAHAADECESKAELVREAERKAIVDGRSLVQKQGSPGPTGAGDFLKNNSELLHLK